jgi:serine/threonine protein kinase
MKEEEIKLVMFQMALALRDIHQAGFAHRDIKPENMLVCLKK